MKRLMVCLLAIGCTAVSVAQEFQARVTVNSAQAGPGFEKRIFQTMQTSLTQFINNRKWTTEAFQNNEKIECYFILNITEASSQNIFKAELSIQAARPVFNTAYKAPLVNFIDKQVVFKYYENQAIEFNENRVQGNDALVANLPAVIAYYIYTILGMDFDSFQIRGGESWFTKAQNIVNNAPDGRDIEGWKAFDGQRNRYWLAENLNNSRYALVHDILYNYYRKGMDFMYENEQQTRTELINCLILLYNLYTENAQNMIVPFFMQARSQEIINIFKKASPTEKNQALEYLRKIDIQNSNKYKQELK